MPSKEGDESKVRLAAACSPRGQSLVSQMQMEFQAGSSVISHEEASLLDPHPQQHKQSGLRRLLGTCDAFACCLGAFP